MIEFEEYIVVFGALGWDEREALCLTHVEYGRSPIGGVAWFPREVPDAA